MNKYTHLKSMKEGDRIWISPRSIEIKDDRSPKEGLLIDLDSVGQMQFSSYYSALVVKKRGEFLVFLTQTAINVYRTFRYRSFSRKVPGKVFLHPKVTFNAHTLCEHYRISTHDSLSVIEILEETLFGASDSEEEVAEKVSRRLNELFSGKKTFTSNLPFSSKPFYSISVMPTDFKITDKFLAIDTMGFCHFKTLAELKQLKIQYYDVREASNG